MEMTLEPEALLRTAGDLGLLLELGLGELRWPLTKVESLSQISL